MALTAGDILTMARTTALDPAPGKLFTDPQGLSYLNSFVRWAIGLKPDLSTLREYLPLVAGSEQELPSIDDQFLDALWTVGGNAVFVMALEDVKHSKFSNIGSMTEGPNPVVACPDPRDPHRYLVFPGSDGSSDSAMLILRSVVPDPMTGTGDTYPIKAQTFDSAYRYVLSVAYARTTTRQDMEKSGAYFEQAKQWFPAGNTAQFGEAPQPDA